MYNSIVKQRKLAVLASCVIITALAFSIPTFANSKKTATTVNVIDVNVGKVQAENVPDTISSLGELSAVQKVTISSETNGRVSAIDFKSGQQVSQGMPIVELDNSQAQSDYEKAVTNYQLAKTHYERASLASESFSQQQLAQLRADVENDKAEVKSKLATLNNQKIKAPFSGILGAFKVQTGDYVSAGDPLVDLVNTRQLQAVYTVPEKQKPRLKPGQLVIVTVSAFPNKRFYGTVNFISPTVSKDTRSIEVRALIPNLQGSLSPGMFAQISQQIATTSNAPVVPEEAVQADIRGYYLFVVNGNKAIKTYVKLGMRVGHMVQILSGVTSDQIIVTAGQQKLSDGSTISIQHSH